MATRFYKELWSRRIREEQQVLSRLEQQGERLVDRVSEDIDGFEVESDPCPDPQSIKEQPQETKT